VDFLSVVYRVLHSDNLGLIVVIRWKNNKIYGVMFILISYMIDEVKHVVLLMLHWNRIIENKKYNTGKNPFKVNIASAYHSGKKKKLN